MPPVNLNDKDLLEWFDSVICFLSKTSLICLLFSGICLWDINSFALFGSLMVFDLYQIIRDLTHKFAQKNFKKSEIPKYILIAVEKLGFICYYVIVCCFIWFKNFYLTLSCIPLLFYLISRCLLYYMRKTTDCLSVMDFCIIVSRIYFFIQNLLVSIKMDHFANWTWKEVFWSFWIFFSVLIGISLGIFLLFITKLCQSLSEINSFYLTELKSLFWVLCLSSNLTILSCLFVLSIIDLYDNKVSVSFFQFIYVLITFWGCIMLLSFFLKKDILRFFHHLNVQDLITSSAREREQGHEMNEIGNEPIITIPKFLLKFSSTYFKRAPEQNMQSVLNRKKKKQKDKEHKIVKTLKKSHSLNDLRAAEKIKASPEKSLNTKEKDTNFIKKYASLSKDEKNLQTQTNNPLFTTQTAENFVTLNENFTENDMKPLSPGKPELVPYPKLEQVEVIIFEDVQEKSFKDMPNGLNHLEEDSKIKSDSLNLISGKEKKLQKESFFQEPIYISKSNMSNHGTNEGLEVKFKSLQAIHSNKNDNSIDLGSPQPSSIKNEGDVSISQRLEKSLVNCLVCFDKTPDSVFMECGHGGVCYECALEVWRNTGECFLCRNKIQQVLQIDLNFRHENYIRVLTATQAQVEEN